MPRGVVEGRWVSLGAAGGYDGRMSTTHPAPQRASRILAAVGEPRGNDGLTDRQRAEYARRYSEGAASRTVSPAERAATNTWLAAKRAGRSLG